MDALKCSEYRMSAQVRASIARLEARLEGIARQ